MKRKAFGDILMVPSLVLSPRRPQHQQQLLKVPDQLKAQHRRRMGAKKSKDLNDEAMAMNPGFSKGKGVRGGRGGGRLPQFSRKLKSEYWNCGEVSHFRNECPNPMMSSEKANDDKGADKAGGANAAEIDWDSNSEGAWAAEEINGDIVASSGVRR